MASTGSGGNVTLTTSTPGRVTITTDTTTGTGTSGGGNVVLSGGNQGGSINLTARSNRQVDTGPTYPKWNARDDGMDQLRLEIHDLKQTLQALFRANQRLCDEVEALKAGVTLDPFGLE